MPGQRPGHHLRRDSDLELTDNKVDLVRPFLLKPSERQVDERHGRIAVSTIHNGISDIPSGYTNHLRCGATPFSGDILIIALVL